MTLVEGEKLQGFVNYAFMDSNGNNVFSLEDILDLQKYKKHGNSVTIPVIEEMVLFVLECIDTLMKND